MESIATLTARHARDGRLDWIGLRPARLAPMSHRSDHAQVTEAGLVGDHGRPGKRAVTLIQAEHLPVIARFAGLDRSTPETLRRNLVISGINLAALRGRRVRIGAVMLRITGPCAPCSRMEAALGPGRLQRDARPWRMVCGGGAPGKIALGDLGQRRRSSKPERGIAVRHRADRPLEPHARPPACSVR
jgi:MOSC domain-containing protein YiiM